MTTFTYVDTPIGALLVAGDTDGIVEIHFAGAKPRSDWVRDDDSLADAASQLRAYFDGELRAFDLPLKTDGTEFQQRVWSALRKIPYGETTTYTAIAERIGRPSAVRAVGAANGANPIPIVIPCHRVIGASGSMTGFGGGIDVKKRLLALEARVSGRTLF
ncbi:MAG TPA: methylated-DNA--[protein]-cysteine S-methyltransferase [Thermoanaerobaculia bacterium]|jgi:methylated-DNA-[protein]-cysteine S-methyltransferase|nr:methylated-DNA--[protein]-cysteine S-methyltransferase [Thermoanaerobaculia bacterium]